ncbi:MAG TPA: SDR family NAD(P)-dependent oxidoreductase, partial [Puia sp.]|nr:SDR family NAD(P)-dependent oxidoreductase [Puia sp.]
MEKVVLITGASSGMGKVMAQLLAEKGFKVYAVARRMEKMQDLAKAGINVFSMDVTDESSMESGVKKVLSNEGRIDVLINNAGIM